MTQGKQLDLIDYASRGTQLWILDNLTGLSSRMLLVLRAIDNKSRGKAAVTMTREDIAKYWAASVATVQRGIEDLEQASLLICKRTASKGQCRGASTYQLVWSNLAAIANGESCESEEATEDGPMLHSESSIAHCATTPVHGESFDSAQCTGPQRTVHRSPAHSATTDYIPRNNRNNRLLRTGTNEEEGEVFRIFKNECGVEFSGSHIQAAIDRGLTQSDALQIADFYRSQPDGKFGPGAVALKVQNWSPGDPPEDCWPSPDPKWVRAEQRRQEALRARELAMSRAQPAKSDKRAVSDNETRYGPILDAMSDGDIDELIRSTKAGQLAYYRTWRKQGRASRTLRNWLLDQLAEQPKQELQP